MRLRRLLGYNLLTAVVLGVIGFYVGWWLGHLVKGPSVAYFDDTSQNDIALYVAYLMAAPALSLARRYGLDACIECGICTYVCPSHLPLLHGIRTLRGERELEVEED